MKSLTAVGEHKPLTAVGDSKPLIVETEESLELLLGIDKSFDNFYGELRILHEFPGE